MITPSETAYYHFSACGSDYDTYLYLYDVVDYEADTCLRSPAPHAGAVSLIGEWDDPGEDVCHALDGREEPREDVWTSQPLQAGETYVLQVTGYSDHGETLETDCDTDYARDAGAAGNYALAVDCSPHLPCQDLMCPGSQAGDYEEAVSYCQSIGGEIATIHSATENELARAACGDSSCWIGLEEVGGERVDAHVEPDVAVEGWIRCYVHELAGWRTEQLGGERREVRHYELLRDGGRRVDRSLVRRARRTRRIEASLQSYSMADAAAHAQADTLVLRRSRRRARRRIRRRTTS